ncbi:MAG: ClpX C4-type zinc finger protein [Pseudomonadota bacterium]
MAEETEADAATDAWQEAMDQRQFKVALKAAMEAYQQHEAKGDEQASMAALGLAHLAMTELLFGEQDKSDDGPSPPSCSFCGQGGADVRLGAGPNVFICADCVGVFYEEAGLRPDKSKGP